MKNFAMVGVGGFVAPRHLKAIADTGNVLLAACDPNDSVGIIDRYFPQASFFTEVERFDRFLEKQRRKGAAERVHYLSVCSPNYLHDAHVRLGLRIGANVICEKPLVISPWNLDALAALEQESGARVNTVLQLRLLPQLIALRQKLQSSAQRSDVTLTYMTRRGRWYHASWKGVPEKSGGLGMNIGIHLFDLMLWLFGPCEKSTVHLAAADRMAGVIELKNARVRWLLSVNGDDLPDSVRREGKSAFRSLRVNGEEIEFSDGFTDIHTRVYEEILAGRGHTIEDSRASIELAYRIRTSVVTAPDADAHPGVLGMR